MHRAEYGVVALTVGGAVEVLNLSIVQPYFVLVALGRFDMHYGYFSFRGKNI